MEGGRSVRIVTWGQEGAVMEGSGQESFLQSLLRIGQEERQGVFAVDRKDRVVLCNAMAATLIGAKPEDLIGKCCHEVFLGQDRFHNLFCYAHCRLWALVREGHPVHPFLFVLKRPDGRMVWTKTRIFMAPIREGEEPLMVHILRVVPYPARTGRRRGPLLARPK